MHRFVEHTAELEIELEADTPVGVLTEASRAFAELVGAGGGETTARAIDLEAPDLPALLAVWLDELIYLSDVDGFVTDTADLTLAGLRLTGTVHGRLCEPRPLVKAVTLHRLRFRPENGVWRGRVVLDV